ncbi:MAG: tetratricopeptide repeat protein [Pyrinomonadaceae bacterium]|nr:tetratricopeptide repeat protein [Pyrinomonadaceae bacterium]
MSKSIIFGISGLLIGLVIGFFAANNINKNVPTTVISQSQTNAPTANPQVQNIVVKDQPASGGMLPDISGAIDKAQNEPNNFDAQVKAGDLYLQIKGFDKAVALYEQANKIKPDDYDLIVKLGNTHFDARQFEKAEQWYAKALAKKADDVNVRTDLGITFVERAAPDYARAVKEFQTSLQTNPKHEPTLYNLGIAYFKSGNKEEAAKTLTQLEAVNPNSQLVGKLRQAIS